MRRRRLNSRNDLSKAITASNLLVDGVQAATVNEDQNFIKALRPKKELPNFFEPQSFVHKQLSIPTHSSKCYVRQYSLSILYLNHLTLTK